MGLRPLLSILTERFEPPIGRAGEVIETLGGTEEALKLHSQYDSLGAEELQFLAAVDKRLDKAQQGETPVRLDIPFLSMRDVDEMSQPLQPRLCHSAK